MASEKTVFFLDDNQDYLNVVTMFVERSCGHHVLAANSYENTVADYKRILNSDLAFLDINLGSDQYSGVDVYRWMKENGYKKQIYFLTGHGKDSFEVQKAEALGAVVLTKPFPNSELKALIEPEIV